MPTHSPHCPCHHSVPSMLQTPENFVPGAEISQARLLWCSPASALEQLQGCIHLLTTKKCKAAEIMLYPGFWGLSCGDYGFSCPLGNLYTFSICPGCLLFSVPPLQALLSWGSQPLAASTLRMEIIPLSAEGNPLISLFLQQPDRILTRLQVSSFSILEHLILYH